MASEEFWCHLGLRLTWKPLPSVTPPRSEDEKRQFNSDAEEQEDDSGDDDFSKEAWEQEGDQEPPSSKADASSMALPTGSAPARHKPLVGSREPFGWLFSETPQVLGTLGLAITLQAGTVPAGHRDTKAREFFHSRNQASLSERAYRPRKFLVTIERGDFLSEECISPSGSAYYGGRYAMRIIFDQSPFPPFEAWTQPLPSHLWNVHWWHCKEFVGRKLPPEEEDRLKGKRAMNDTAFPGARLCGKTIGAGLSRAFRPDPRPPSAWDLMLRRQPNGRSGS